MSLVFIGWFLNKGMDFKKNSSWKSLANVRTKRVLVDTERRSYYSRKEIVDIYKKYKLPQRSCNKFLMAHGMQSTTSTKVVSFDELSAALKDTPIPLNQVCVC